MREARIAALRLRILTGNPLTLQQVAESMSKVLKENEKPISHQAISKTEKNIKIKFGLLPPEEGEEENPLYASRSRRLRRILE